METKTPLLSIAIPTYNSEKTICATVTSCLEQTWPYFELVIVDDGSTDKTIEKVKGINDSRIRFVERKINSGAVSNWNRCIDETNGKFLLILHHDDWLFTGALSCLALIIESCPTVGIISLRGSEKDVPRESEEITHTKDNSFTYFPAGLQSMFAIVSQAVYCSSVVVRREVYEKEKVFNPEYPYFADEEMWVRAAQHWPFVIRNSPAVGVRAGGEHLMYRTWEKDDFWEQWLLLHREIMNYMIKSGEKSGCDISSYKWQVEKKILDSAHYIAKFFLSEGKPMLARKFISYAASCRFGYNRPRRHQLLVILSRLPKPILKSALLQFGYSKVAPKS